MLDQLRALLALRLLLLKRLWLRSASGVAAGFVLVLLTAVSVIAATAVGIALFFYGWRVLPGLEGPYALITFDAATLAILFVWAAGMATEIQRSDAIDFRKMLYLPVSLRMVFFLNFMVSLLSPLAVFFTLGILGLSLGMAFGLGPRMLLAIPVAAAFYLMLAAWAYHLRGLLAVIMENKRRRRLR